MEPLSWCRERLERHRWRQSQIEQTIKDFRETADGGEFATRKLAELQSQLSESNADVADALDRLHHFAAESAVLSHGRLLIRQRRLGSGAPSLREDFKRHANFDNPALTLELKRLEMDAAYAELAVKDAQSALESAL
jgi:uncharacterized protein YigA (DUF484 family)